jgi:hypothetical protein
VKKPTNSVPSGLVEVHVEPGGPPSPHATLRTDPATLNTLLADPGSPAGALAAGRAVVTGDEPALQRLLQT